ncbi:MAG: pyruvate dehydrogenase complex E1 component subunit beta [Myxococcota bacterium]|nr:pyruvate dehydrogenase complex E1 component subunit beta [Myxococcota bacterium]
MPSGATYIEAVREALHEELTVDDRVFLMGEDIGAYGGAFKVTDGFRDHFGEDRIIDTPIAEAGIIGAAIGAALTGLRPVVEIQFLDFLSCGFDQLTNFAAKCHYRWGAEIPIVVRGPGGGGVGGGPFHSQSIEMYFIKTPGIKVVAPSTPTDAKILLKAAIRDPNPVLFIEHKALYRQPALRETLPDKSVIGQLGRAAIRRPGDDLVIISYGAMVHKCIEAAEVLSQDGVRTRILDLRTLQPLDDEMVLAAVKECGKVLIAHEDTRTAGLAGELTSRINENVFEWLDAPVLRVTAADTPVPYNKELEKAFLPQVGDIVKTARELAAY